MFDMRKEILKHLGRLKKYAVTLTRCSDSANDLVNETVLKAIAKQDSFTEGTNLIGWLFVIMRNTHFTNFRNQKRRFCETLSDDDEPILQMSVRATQFGDVEVVQILALIKLLPKKHRNVIYLLSKGHEYTEIAERLEVPIGTIKSRVNRARITLKKLLETPDSAHSLSHVLQAKNNYDPASQSV